MIPHKKLGLVIAILGWGFIAAMTLYPTPESAKTNATISIWCLVCGDLGVVDVILNCILFIPLGVGLGWCGISRWRAILLIAGTTFAVELLQLRIITGRDASLSDLLTNATGGILGLFLAGWWPRVLLPRPRVSLALALTGAACWVGIQGFTGWALERALPRSEYFGQWAPELAQFERFTGTVTSVTLNDRVLPGYRLDASNLVREALLAPHGTIRIMGATGEPTPGVAPIFSIFDDHQRQILIVGQNGRDVMFRIRTRSDGLKLRGTAIKLEGALPGEAGKPFTVQAEFGNGFYRLSVQAEDRSISRDLSEHASWGWSFLLPFEHAFGKEMAWLSMTWIAGLLFPIGYWAGRSRLLHPLAAGVGIAILLVLGLRVAPTTFDLAPGVFSEWIIGLLGSWAGWRFGRWISMRPASKASWAGPSQTASQ
ncbi:MAG: VanZ family protein [Gemmatimonadota bacterium]